MLVTSHGMRRGPWPQTQVIAPVEDRGMKPGAHMNMAKSAKHGRNADTRQELQAAVE